MKTHSIHIALYAAAALLWLATAAAAQADWQRNAPTCELPDHCPGEPPQAFPYRCDAGGVTYRCLADLDGDCDVRMEDLVLLLERWGEVPEPLTPGLPYGDFNRDNVIDDFDESFLLAHFGPCPLLGDLDGNGKVDEVDRCLLITAYGTSCRADVNRDQQLDGADIDSLASRWQQADPLADVDRDGVVGMTDLLAIQSAITSAIDCRGDLDGDGWVCYPDLMILDGKILGFAE